MTTHHITATASPSRHVETRDVPDIGNSAHLAEIIGDMAPSLDPAERAIVARRLVLWGWAMTNDLDFSIDQKEN